ncbi:uncharacterized protein STEHIDRAFT_141346 [Stereum hirsutum FP-91666 SS1]|uniref:uncharacterized protein n=1 Tax=Stereum hirsutum (strain FP-91666) TaxID=721885 RepID=UPI0004449A8B|nr:uncharacterized protein STEHIDRAFT_141346 [Stereum hirsutum FP-91666 SS1]EIM83159.1 hypothetical protein STEHIDRAFT_141346 [Stereum hirsutum FP-91666 SS1]
MFATHFIAFATMAAVAFVGVRAETHTINFVNNCGFGTPTLVSQSGQILSTGGTYTAGGAIVGAIAYLQTGGCGLNGDYCTTVETTLKNGVGASSTDITLIPDHAFSVTTGFGYYNGCDGAGADCTYSGCPTAFHVSTDTFVQVGCSTDNVDLAITFCD